MITFMIRKGTGLRNLNQIKLQPEKSNTFKVLSMDKIEEIKRLKLLLDQGAINNDEFQRVKNSLLSQDNQQSVVQISVSNSKGASKLKKRGLKFFIITVIAISFLLFILNYLGINNKIKLNILQNPKDNIYTNNVDSLKVFNNNIYEKGKLVGKLVTVEFIKITAWSGLVFNVPVDKMWTELYFDYQEIGDVLYIYYPVILTEQITSQSVGQTYYMESVYDDKKTHTWWRNHTGILELHAKEDFKSIKYSLRNNKAITGLNAIYSGRSAGDVKYTLYFFEEPLE